MKTTTTHLWSDSARRRTTLTRCLAVLIATLPGELMADPTPDAITGKYYQIEEDALEWDRARVAANGLIVLGVSGHLVTVQDARENAIVRALGGSQDKWIGLTDSESMSILDSFDLASLGTSEAGNTSGLPLPPAGMAPTAGQRGAGFAWVTMEPFTFQNWRAGTPGDTFQADAVFMIGAGDEWQDNPAGPTVDQAGPFGPNPRSYVIEWETEPLQEKFRVIERKAAATWNNGTGNITTLENAELMLALPPGDPHILEDGHGEAYVISFQDPELGGGLQDYTRTPYILNQLGIGDDNFAWRAEAWVSIPAAGQWTFGVTSGDDFRLEVGGNTFVGSGNLPNNPPQLTRSGILGTVLTPAPGGTGDTFYFSAPGMYPLTLTSFESDFFGFIQFFGAQGDQDAFDPDFFDLVGDVVNGGIALTPCPDDVTLRIAMAPGGSGYRLTWNGQVGFNYRVDFATDLVNWGFVSGVIAGALPDLSFDHVPGVPEGFYRIVLVP